MESRQYDQVTQEEWDAAEEDFKSRYRIPERITDEQARELFAKIARSALYSVTFRYANHHRYQRGYEPLRQPPLPRSLTEWIDDRISAVDDHMGRPGADYYQRMVNGLLTHLRSAEHHFLGHGK